MNKGRLAAIFFPADKGAPAPRSLAIYAHGSPSNNDAAEIVTRSLRRFAEVVGCFFAAPETACLYFQDPLLDRLLIGSPDAGARRALAAFLDTWQPPPGVGITFPVHTRTLPPDLVEAGARFSPRQTAGDRALVWLMGYSAREEITRAARVSKPGVPFEQGLVTAGFPDPDLLIVTGASRFLPDFLLYQVSYGEIHFAPRPWPDFALSDLAAAWADYGRRERRYGKL